MDDDSGNDLATALLVVAVDEENASSVEDGRREGSYIRLAETTGLFGRSAEEEEEEAPRHDHQEAPEELSRHKRILNRRVLILSILYSLLGIILSLCVVFFVRSVLFGSSTPSSWEEHDEVVPGNNNRSRSCSGSICFPTRDDTLAMATLSEVIYYFHRSKLPGNVICQNFNDRNFTELLLLLQVGDNDDESPPAPSSLLFENNGADSDEFTVPLGDAYCHWYQHDWSLGSQVMVVESKIASYIAIVFCGTDDLTTSLTDVNIFRTRYGLTSNGTEILPDVDPAVLVHAGFDHAVFDDDLFTTIWRTVEPLLLSAASSSAATSSWHHRNDHHSEPHRPYRIFTTGHSLGAADAILTAVGLLDKLEEQEAAEHYHTNNVTVLNFGCPRTGNIAWRDFVHAKQDRLSVWRFVLGWDLVPRLPEFYHHVGHTIQLSEHDDDDNVTMRAYFHHVGNASLGYAGVPLGWSATPYVWLPGALSSHHIGRYRNFFLNNTNNTNDTTNHGDQQRQHWVRDFVKVDDHVDPDPVDDDFYDKPPDEFVSSQ
jgi:Lipase (class 3)